MKILLAILLLGMISVAQAQTQCPADTVVGTVMTPGFSCVLQDKTFSAFDITGVPTDTRIQFGILGPLFAVTLARDGGFFPAGTTVFDYTISASAPNHILQGTVGVDVSFPSVVTVTTMNGMAVSPALLLNGATGTISFSPGITSAVVDNISHIFGAGELNSISNDFAQTVISVPEPGTLTLLCGGLLGLAWGWAFTRRNK
jgi:hypothetical protein